MRTTASFDLFPDAPSERAIARARWLAREGRIADAEQAYRSVLVENPDLKACWAECFELLRTHHRAEDALRLAEGALGHFGAVAFPFALQGAALIELGRYRDALQALEQALERDPELALGWHELGYACYRLGDRNRALLALDRAFALEPHAATLNLRGRILRDAGRYQAAEVAFEGAAQAAEHREQREAAEHEIHAARRFAFYAPRKPEELPPAERWFAETGSVVLASRPAPATPGDETLVEALLTVAGDAGWRFGQVVAVGPTLPVWNGLATNLSAPLVSRDALDPAACPLVVAVRPLPADPTWSTATAAVVENGAGLVFALEHPGDSDPSALASRRVEADVIGVLTDEGARRHRGPDTTHALSESQHPAVRFAGRRLTPSR